MGLLMIIIIIMFILRRYVYLLMGCFAHASFFYEWSGKEARSIEQNDQGHDFYQEYEGITK